MINTCVRRRHNGFVQFVVVLIVVAVLIAGAVFVARKSYIDNLKPVSGSTQSQLVTIKSGSTTREIANQLHDAGLIRAAWAFEWYVRGRAVRDALQAGTYNLRPNQSVQQIVAALTHGKIAYNLVTILPGQRLDQIRDSLIKQGFKKNDVANALDPASHAGNPMLAYKPAKANLEGLLYPDSFQKSDQTSASQIIEQSLNEMNQQLTPDIRAAFQREGLSLYQGVVLASMVTQEVSNPSDQRQVAQVFLSRLKKDMLLGSDVTAYYGAVVAGAEPSVGYDSPYNTRLHKGLPPTPISNVTASSLEAVAHPANTDWLYFVAGDDGVTHFARTVGEHEVNVDRYCKKLCGGM